MLVTLSMTSAGVTHNLTAVRTTSESDSSKFVSSVKLDTRKESSEEKAMRETASWDSKN